MLVKFEEEKVEEPTPVVEVAPVAPVTLPKKEKKLGLFARVKKVKNFEIYLAVGLILIMVAIYMTTFGGGSGDTKPKKTAEENFAREMEARLVKTLSQISGAGRIEAMVTVEGSATIEVAYNVDERTVTQNGGNGSATTTTTIVKTPVVLNGRDGPQPLILFEIKPKIKGVVIVASGAADVGVRLQLLRAVQTVIADDSARIEIFSGRQIK
jgi:stage III sporulation protein AG